MNSQSLYDNKLPLGVFLEPEIVLNTLRQKTCRSIKKPLDELEMNVTFGEQANNDSIYSFKVKVPSSDWRYSTGRWPDGERVYRNI